MDFLRDLQGVLGLLKMPQISDPILRAIDRQQTACTLYALRSVLTGNGKWSDDLHGPAYQAKFEALCGRWKG